MVTLREKYIKHICLIALILLQVIGFNTVQGLKCVQCGNNGTNCKDDLKDDPADCPPEGTYNKCYTKIDGDGKISRGCLMSANESTCASDTNCFDTEGSKNNQLICKSCLGSDADCSQTDASDSKYSKICDAGITKCIRKITDKLVVRGCANPTEVTACTDKNTCEICEGINCNTGIFPTNRLSCFQCSGDKCNDVTANTLKAKPCLLLEDKDECYTRGESDTTMTRGCKSDKNENKCSTTAEGCVVCNESGCNKLKYKGQPTLKCYQCTSDSKNADCFKNQTDTTLKTCVQDILYNATQYCYIQIEGEKIQRGCLNDNAVLTEDKCKDAEGGACSKCVGEGCNGKNVEFTCIVCRSDEHDKCWNEADTIQGKGCRTGNGSPSDGCFHGVWRGVAIRGCTIDSSAQNQELCKEKNNPNNCEICHSKDCNVKKSSATQNSLSFVLMSVLMITLRK